MSSPSKNTMASNDTAQQAKSKVTAQATNSSNLQEKRSIDNNNVLQTKRIKVETPVLEQKASMIPSTSTTPPKFVSAATMAPSASEITDEELLEFTLEFERKHGI